MKHAARWSVVIGSLLLLVWVALSGPGPEAPSAPPLPTPATTK